MTTIDFTSEYPTELDKAYASKSIFDTQECVFKKCCKKFKKKGKKQCKSCPKL